MYDFNNPLRPEIEQLLFPNQDAVTYIIGCMDDSLQQIAVLSKDDPDYAAIVQRNLDYIRVNLAYEAIAQSEEDLTRFNDALK